MKVLINLEQREVKGNKGVRFEVFDGNRNIGSFIVGKASIRWAEPKWQNRSKSKTWKEVQDWLLNHGRDAKM